MIANFIGLVLPLVRGLKVGVVHSESCVDLVGPEMMPIVGSKIYVNTQTKILALNIKNLQVRKLNHRK